jgi:putative MATE family efflux protein
MGMVGSAVANVVGQTLGAGLFLSALVREGTGTGRPRLAVLRAQLALGRDLLTRSLAFQACFLSAAAVATRFGAEAAGAHQIVLQLWNFMALVLDAVAIAAQSLVGAALGSGGAARARALAGQVTRYGLVLGIGFGILFAALVTVLPPVFTPDPAVLAAIVVPWWFFAALQPAAGVVFAVDGVLLGAGDAGYLRTTTLLAAVLGFLPLIWASLLFGWGLVGIWSGLAGFMLVRLVAVLARLRSGRWAVVGAQRP